MPLVRIGTKHQVVIPKKVFSELGLRPGDYVDISVRRNRAILTRKKLVDDFPTTDEKIGRTVRASIRRGVKEVQSGKTKGPFKNAGELIEDLHRARRTRKKS